MLTQITPDSHNYVPAFAQGTHCYNWVMDTSELPHDVAVVLHGRRHAFNRERLRSYKPSCFHNSLQSFRRTSLRTRAPGDLNTFNVGDKEAV